MDRLIGGIDIGGTKCAVVIGREEDGEIRLLKKETFPTPNTPKQTIFRLTETLENLLQLYKNSVIQVIGISCGGPLNSKTGLIMSPPNLPEWIDIDIVSPFKERFNVPVFLQNDANACAMAEWLWGAGDRCNNMIFLTFGTGLGAGLILNGRLYEGTNGMAGEIGHIRLAESGPIGFGKAGSFEGFCSGGGIAQLARERVKSWMGAGKVTSICSDPLLIEEIETKDVGEAARQGDSLAVEIFGEVGRRLGQGLSVLIDILNPEMIVIGSIYTRQQNFIEPSALEVIRREALWEAQQVCRIVPAQLAENVGDFASFAVAINGLR